MAENFLEKILDAKAAEVALRKRQRPLQIADMPRHPHRDFRYALTFPGLALIAEIKRASPSKGLLAPNLDPITLARQYMSAGAAAISVLTDEQFFKGSLHDLRAVSLVSDVPVLRKDFVIDLYQVMEAVVEGADAVLLIVAALGEKRLKDLLEGALELGVEPLVEVHDDAELDIALAAGARVVGINNRDLTTFEVDLSTTARLAPKTGDGVIVVAESGIHTSADVKALADAGADAVLIGEALVKARQPEDRIRDLFFEVTE